MVETDGDILIVQNGRTMLVCLLGQKSQHLLANAPRRKEDERNRIEVMGNVHDNPELMEEK